MPDPSFICCIIVDVEPSRGRHDFSHDNPKLFVSRRVSSSRAPFIPIFPMSDIEEELVVRKLKIVLVGDSGSGKVSFPVFPIKSLIEIQRDNVLFVSSHHFHKEEKYRFGTYEKDRCNDDLNCFEFSVPELQGN